MFSIQVLTFLLTFVYSQGGSEDMFRIFNGHKPVSYADYNYMVALVHRKALACSASVLSKRFALTAAHCLSYKLLENDSDYSVFYGSAKFDIEAGTVIKAQEIFVHPDYDISDMLSVPDIAVLKLEKNLPIPCVVRPVRLPPACESVTPNTCATIGGWGVVDGYLLTTTLHVGQVRTFSDAECEDIDSHYVDVSRQVCAGDPERGIGACAGDSGGPLTIDGDLQVGVACRVKDCIFGKTLYVKVSAFVPWILSIMEK